MTKRIFDFLCAGTGLIVLFPLLLILTGLGALIIHPPVFFVQKRPGLHGRPFRLVKFRSMREASDSHGEPLPDGQRITPYGAFLRKTSLDEWPELLNVLLGKMSLVGPRPLLLEYLPLYSPFQARRHEVRPGITGWSQVHGRNDLGWEDRLAMDVWYVDNRTFLLDLKILAKTVAIVFDGSGVNQKGQATMKPFQGPGG